MKRQQKRYTTEEEILTAINELHKKAQDLFTEAIAEDRAAAGCLEEIKTMTKDRMSEAEQMVINKLNHMRTQHMERSVKLNKSRNTILNAKLPRIKETLAAFKTAPMPFLEDQSVPA